jgi:hypothetical protein
LQATGRGGRADGRDDVVERTIGRTGRDPNAAIVAAIHGDARVR